MSTSIPQYHAAKRDKIKVINWLIEHYPAAFFKKTRFIKPLTLGIIDPIFEFYHRLETPPFSKKSLRNALAYYCTSPAYLSAQKKGKARIDLYGNEIDIVTEEQEKYAQLRYERQYLSPNTQKNITPSSPLKDNLHQASSATAPSD
jgi:ProP effector